MGSTSMIELNEEQKQNIRQGKPVRVAAPDLGADCIVLRADVYDKLRSVLEDDSGLDMRTIALLIERNMREDDIHDPLLESYQDSRSPS